MLDDGVGETEAELDGVGADEGVLDRVVVFSAGGCDDVVVVSSGGCDDGVPWEDSDVADDAEKVTEIVLVDTLDTDRILEMGTVRLATCATQGRREDQIGEKERRERTSRSFLTSSAPPGT